MTGLTRRGFEWFTRAAFRWYCRLHVTGRDRLPPLPYIVCSNHSSHMDAIVLMAATGRPFAQFGLLAATDYFFSNALVHRAFSSLVKLIPIDRERGSAGLPRTIGLCREFLAPGERGLVIFPEGTRSRTGQIGRFKRGVALIASELALPIVPAYIEGSSTLMPKGRLFPRPGRVTVHLGEPIAPAQAPDHDALVQLVEARVLALQASSAGVQPA